MYPIKQNNQSSTTMTKMTINNSVLEELHSFDISTGGSYPFISISVNEEEVAHIDIVPGLSVHYYDVMPGFVIDGEEYDATTVEIVTHMDGKYDYVQILDMAGHELHCHEGKKVAS